MLTTIKGIYENGIVKPLEKMDVKGKVEVIITFLNTAKKEIYFSLCRWLMGGYRY